MASFRAIMDALTYEIKRQAEVIESGGELTQETRLYDEEKGITIPMRGKEDAPDYRYFPEPDLVELEISQELINRIRAEMPELPRFKAERLVREYHISQTEASLLTKQRKVSDFFEQSFTYCKDSKKLASWIIKELFKLLNEHSVAIEDCPIAPKHFGRLIAMISQGQLTEPIGRIVLDEMFQTGKSPEIIIQEKDLKPIQQDDVLTQLVEEVIRENPSAIDKVRQGDTQPINFLIGQIMRKTGGKADPHKVRKLLSDKLLS